MNTRPHSSAVEATVYTTVCALSDIDVESGVTALVDGRAVAVFRTHTDQVWALDNYDPYSGASVLARGLVGTLERNGTVVDFVASPMHKQRFDLRTGRSLEDEGTGVPRYQVRVVDGVVRVAGAGKAQE